MEQYKNDCFDIIIQGGQSNAEGCGKGNKRLFKTDDRILYLNGDMTISLACERSADGFLFNDFSLSFAAGYIKAGLLAKGRKILIIRSAAGGTGFLDKRWRPADDLRLRLMDMIAAALSLNKANKPVAFIWHQGETDACLNATRDIHFNNLTGLLNEVRLSCKSPDLPFIAGDFVKEWKDMNLELCAPVITAIKDVCKGKNCAFIETADLKSNNQAIADQDTIHFSWDAINTLGERYLDEYMKLRRLM